MKKIAIIGLGRFGWTLARELGSSGLEVLAIDRDNRLVNDIREYVTVAVQLDSTDEEAMRDQNIGTIDVCVVAIGEGFESALLTTLIAKKLGAKRVLARAQTVIEGDILSRIGADEIIQPEVEVGQRLAYRLAHPHLEALVDLDREHGIVRVRAPRAFHDKPLNSLDLRQRHGVTVIAIKRPGQGTEGKLNASGDQIIIPGATDVIRENDMLFLVGNHSALARLPRE